MEIRECVLIEDRDAGNVPTSLSWVEFIKCRLLALELFKRLINKFHDIKHIRFTGSFD